MSAILQQPKTAPRIVDAVNLSKHYRIGQTMLPGSGSIVRAVDDVSFSVAEGETLGLVGESGCGKSTLGRCITRLYDVSEGQLMIEGVDITHATRKQLQPFRRKMQMIFQDPSASLNPRRRVEDIIAEPLRVHNIRAPGEIDGRVKELMDLVGLPAEYAARYPHEFSGGQRQRIGIARALAMEPRLIVADEPVSALDVSIQAQIVNLFADLRERLGLTYIFIAHDLSVVRQVSNRTAVMYLGSIVEIGRTDTVFGKPAHPYTEALISAIPETRRGPQARRKRIILEGEVPSPLDPPSGCKFSTRCPIAVDRCRDERPILRPLADGRSVACHFPRVSADPLQAPLGQ